MDIASGWLPWLLSVAVGVGQVSAVIGIVAVLNALTGHDNQAEAPPTAKLRRSRRQRKK